MSNYVYILEGGDMSGGQSAPVASRKEIVEQAAKYVDRFLCGLQIGYGGVNEIDAAEATNSATGMAYAIAERLVAEAEADCDEFPETEGSGLWQDEVGGLSIYARPNFTPGDEVLIVAKGHYNGQRATVVNVHPEGQAAVVRVHSTGVCYSETLTALRSVR